MYTHLLIMRVSYLTLQLMWPSLELRCHGSGHILSVVLVVSCTAQLFLGLFLRIRSSNATVLAIIFMPTIPDSINHSTL